MTLQKSMPQAEGRDPPAEGVALPEGEAGAFGEASSAAAATSAGRAARHLRKGPMPTLLEMVSSILDGEGLPPCMCSDLTAIQTSKWAI